MPNESYRRVLVVDDDDDVRRLLSSALGPRGLTVDTAADGKDAIDLLRENTYAVVLLDLLMPGIDGFGVIDAMKAESMPSPPVVLVLTGADRSVVDTLDPQRIHGVVRKPFDPEELAALVVACSEIKSRGTFGTMAIATMISGAPFLAWLCRS
ncbi:MAG TPA: response regulator [Thermoanaerobaculia bacterium]|jgi:CheY-like chemotaxis protein|nr:response regulator [Thermoanaerobaculia bacterium]